MERTIAVEEGLWPVREYLREKGYHVVDMKAGARVDAAVISGGDADMMGVEKMALDAPVINASGKTPEAVWRELEKKILH